jgi:hypothetical protein
MGVLIEAWKVRTVALRSFPHRITSSVVIDYEGDGYQY